MKTIATATSAVLLLAANGAAAIERFDCHQPNSPPTIIELDRADQTFTLSENGKTKFDRLSVCASLAKIVSDIPNATDRRCSIAFGKTVVAADYSGEFGSGSFVMAIALNTKDMTLTAIGRIGTIDGFSQTAPCRRL